MTSTTKNRKASIILNQFATLFQNEWPELKPIGENIRRSGKPWRRFYTLNDGKRYPEIRAEYDEILARHHALLSRLLNTAPYLVMVPIWTESLGCDNNASIAGETYSYWQSVDESWQDGNEIIVSYRHVYIRENTEYTGLSKLLTLVADDELAGVLIAPKDAGWLYHPYDGGMDIATDHRDLLDELSQEFNKWLGESSEQLDSACL